MNENYNMVESLNLIASKTEKVSTGLSEINTLLVEVLSRPWYQEYQELIGTFFAVITPIVVSYIILKSNKKEEKINKYTELVYLINKEINTIENYKENIDEQVRILNSLKYNELDANHTFVFKDGPVIISNYKSFIVSNLYSTESNFINSQLVFCIKDSENFEFNSNLISLQIDKLFDRTNNMISLSVNIPDRNSINPEHIKKQFNDGIDRLSEILTKKIKTKLEEHKIDFIVLLSSLNEYIRLYRKSSSLVLWQLIYNKKNSFLWFNIYNKNDSDDDFLTMYNFFKKKGEKDIRVIERYVNNEPSR